MNNFTPEKIEKRKKMIFDAMGKRGQKQILKKGYEAWDVWNYNDCDPRFGDDWPGRIPAQMIGHILFYFSHPDDLIFDPPYFHKIAEGF
jgi:hypothetical protein